jgi:hypothetical protein
LQKCIGNKGVNEENANFEKKKKDMHNKFVLIIKFKFSCGFFAKIGVF